MPTRRSGRGGAANEQLHGRPTHNLFAIYVPPIDRSTVPLQSRIRLVPKLKDIQHEFAKYLAGVIQFEVQRAIETQRYKWNWTPLSERYLKSKIRRGESLNIWEATGYLKNNITVWKSGSRYVVGLRTWAKNPINGQPLYVIAKSLEMGVPSRNIPPRPLFRPIFNFVTKNIGRYLDHFLRTYEPKQARKRRR